VSWVYHLTYLVMLALIIAHDFCSPCVYKVLHLNLGGLRVVALVGSRSVSVFEHLVGNPPESKVCALIGNGFVPKSIGKINKLMVLSKEETLGMDLDKFNPKEMFPNLREGDFLLMLGFPRGAFPKVFAGIKGEHLDDTSFGLAQIGNMGLEGIKEVSLDDLWEHLLNTVPEYPALLNCGLCGFKTCNEYLKKAIGGENVKCLSNHIFLSVDKKVVEINPFIIKQLKVLIKAYLSTLKGIDVDKMKELHMKLDYG